MFILTPTQESVRVNLNTIREEMSLRFVERRPVIEAMILAVLAKQHCFILGPPGTGKSAMCRDFFRRFIDSTYFEALLSKTRPAEAILGPWDIPALRDHGDMHRRYKGFLPDVDLALLDEIGNMSPSLGHDLLALLEERLLHQVNGGRSAMPVPLNTVIGGSNSLPAAEDTDAAAAWDRMVIRTWVDHVRESGNFIAMLLGDLTWDGTETTVPWADVKDVIENVIPKIPVSVDAQDAILRLRDVLLSLEIDQSGRRWKHSLSVAKANAFLRGAEEVGEDDMQVFRYTMWETPQQITAVERACLSVANPAAEAAMSLLDDIEEIARGIRDLKGRSVEEKSQYGTEANSKLKVIQSELGQKRQEALAAGRSTTQFDQVGDRIKAVKRAIYVDLLEMDPQVLRD